MRMWKAAIMIMCITCDAHLKSPRRFASVIAGDSSEAESPMKSLAAPCGRQGPARAPLAANSAEAPPGGTSTNHQ
jgi:hypothetical protein